MALLDIFKKKKKVPEKKEFEKKLEKKTKEKIAPAVKPRRARKPAAAPKLKKISDVAYRVLRGPHITEKATDLTDKNQYVFEVFPKAGKAEVKRAVEDLYGANVVSVRIINVPSKKRRLGRIEGERKGYKKAIVKIVEGQKIEVLPR